jgi:hypothetical protein
MNMVQIYRDMYTSDEDIRKNLPWDAKDAPWKIRHILDIMEFKY